ncbi:small s protein [Immersiella caudata]|uniref:Small s protein n=1 Tax=Immersiella caudata TaxID=314043 RepID=A0AA39WJN0_9PEZI|nr:small s protein [Immersiella caudata]
MDPFTAISLAGNILQFITFVKTIYKTARELQKSATGLAKADEALHWSASELQTIVDNITAGVGSIPDHPGRSNNSSDLRIRELGRQCREISEELVSDLGKKGTQNKFSFLDAVKSAMRRAANQSELDEKTKRLNDVQNALFKHLVAHISNQQHGVSRAIADLVEQNRKLAANRTDDLEALKSQVHRVSSLLESSLKTASVPLDTELQTLQSSLGGWSSKAEQFKREQAVIASLQFPGMHARRNEIHARHQNTFEWILSPRVHFQEWLHDKSGVFWISGEPGCGKSTLMKHLCTDSVNDQALRQWAAPRKLVKAGFYFVRQEPSLIPTICPERWGDEPSDVWNVHELLSALDRVASQQLSVRFCFFIDGLDEYQQAPSTNAEGTTCTHTSEVIQIMATLSKIPDIKLCVSSRPWLPFEQAFGRILERKLYVHVENRDDIRLYIRDKLETSDIFLDSRLDRRDLQYLIDDILDNSGGVFLWVVLVVQSLLRGLANLDRPSELRKRLSQMPKTLNGYFDRMLDSVEDIYQEQTAQILQTSLHAVEPLYVVTYSFIGENDPACPTGACTPWSEDECVMRARTAEVRIKVRCPDLLRIVATIEAPRTAQEMIGNRVDYLHRTVRDFLALEETQKRLRRSMTADFDAGVYICNSLLAQIKGAAPRGRKTRPGSELLQLVDDITFYLRDVEQRLDEPQMSILEQLHTALVQKGYGVVLYRGSFLGYAVEKDLQAYVHNNISAVTNAHTRAILLDRALSPIFKSRYPATAPSIEMVKLLLRNGAGPNESAEGTVKSVWERYLTILYKTKTASRSLPNHESHIIIIQELLKHGADPSVSITTSWTERKVTMGKGGGRSYPIYMDFAELVQFLFSPIEREYIEMLMTQRSGVCVVL